jgi:3-hydroxyisobutyrate dehydrogenase
VAVIGAGIMGSAMARNLVAAGLTTRVWDRSPSATGPLADAGAVVAASAREAVRDAGAVITMLPTADVVDSVVFDAGVAGGGHDAGAHHRGEPVGPSRTELASVTRIPTAAENVSGAASAWASCSR